MDRYVGYMIETHSVSIDKIYSGMCRARVVMSYTFAYKMDMCLWSAEVRSYSFMNFIEYITYNDFVITFTYTFPDTHTHR